MTEYLIDPPSIILTPNGQHSPNGQHTFPELFDIWIGFLEAEEKSERTIETYRWTAGQFIAFLEAEGVKPDAISVAHTSVYAAEVKKRPGRKKPQNGDPQQISAWGRYALLKDARAFLNWLHKNRYLPHPIAVPVPKAPKVSIPHLKGKGQIEAFEEAALGGRNRWRDEALVALMLETGLRNFEARAVNFDHLSFRDERPSIGHVLVPEGKGRKRRTVPFPPDVWRALCFLKRDIEERYGPEAIKDDAPVFLLESGARMGRDGMRMLFKRLSERAGLWVTPHMLRHTYAITMVKRGLHITVLQKFLGHASIETTMIYLQLTEDDGTDDLYLEALQNGG